MCIRPFKDSDYSTITRIYANTKLDELRYEDKVFELLPLEEDAVRLKQLSESDIYLYDNGEVLGYGAVFGQEIRALFVLSKYRGLGVGQAILAFLMAKAGGEMSLYLASSNLPAKRLYEKYGFITVETFETRYNGLAVFADKMVRPAVG